MFDYLIMTKTISSIMDITIERGSFVACHDHNQLACVECEFSSAEPVPTFLGMVFAYAVDDHLHTRVGLEEHVKFAIFVIKRLTLKRDFLLTLTTNPQLLSHAVDDNDTVPEDQQCVVCSELLDELCFVCDLKYHSTCSTCYSKLKRCIMCDPCNSKNKLKT